MENGSLAAGRREELLDSYEQERRPVAESLLHLSTRLLDSQKQGGIKRERDVQQLDIQYTNSPLAHTLPERQHGLQAGERAPDAPLLGAGVIITIISVTTRSGLESVGLRNPR